MTEAEATVARTMGTAPAKEMVTAEDTAAKEMAMAEATVAMAEATVAMAEATVVMARETATMTEDTTMEVTVAKETGVPCLLIAPGEKLCAHFMEDTAGGIASTTRATEDAFRTNATGPSTMAMPLNGSLKIAGVCRRGSRGSSNSLSSSSSNRGSSISFLPRLVFLQRQFLQHPEGRMSTSQPSIRSRLRPSQRRADRTSINPPSERRQPLSSSSKGGLRAA